TDSRDVWDVIQNDEALRKRVNRAFCNLGSRSKAETALYLYGFNDFEYVPSKVELSRCWSVSKEGVCFESGYFRELLSVSNLPKKDLLNLVEGVKGEAINEYISDFLTYEAGEKFTLTVLRKTLPCLYRYIYN